MGTRPVYGAIRQLHKPFSGTDRVIISPVTFTLYCQCFGLPSLLPKHHLSEGWAPFKLVPLNTDR